VQYTPCERLFSKFVCGYANTECNPLGHPTAVAQFRDKAVSGRLCLRYIFQREVLVRFSVSFWLTFRGVFPLSWNDDYRKKASFDGVVNALLGG